VAAVGTLNVVGKGTVMGARYILPLRGQDDFYQTATLGVDHKDFSQAVNLIGSGGFNTPITYMPFTLGWDGSWLDGARSTRLGVAFNFHVRGVVGDEQEFADKRFKGRPGYAYLRGTAQHTYTLTSGWGASARMSWQLSLQPLISNEQFTIGGVDTVRGYLESAASGDSGLALSLEASTPNWAKGVSDTLDEARLLAFVDGGKVKVLSPITADEYYNLVGAGLGLRVKGWRGVSATLDWALAMQELAGTQQGDSRLYFKLGYEW
jgi:hemolysin activation/secretion protein